MVAAAATPLVLALVDEVRAAVDAVEAKEAALVVVTALVDAALVVAVSEVEAELVPPATLAAKVEPEDEAAANTATAVVDPVELVATSAAVAVVADVDIADDPALLAALTAAARAASELVPLVVEVAKLELRVDVLELAAAFWVASAELVEAKDATEAVLDTPDAKAASTVVAAELAVAVVWMVA